MKKIARVLSSFLPMLCGFLLQFAILLPFSFALGVIYGLLISTGNTDASILDRLATSGLSTEESLLFMSIYGITSAVLFGIWYKSLTKHTPKPNVKQMLKPKRLLLLILLGLCIQLGLSLILTIIMNIVPSWFERYNEIIEGLVIKSSILSLLYTGIIAPISEEFIFRGVTLQRTIKLLYRNHDDTFADEEVRKKRHKDILLIANIIQAVAFGIYHLNWVQGIYAAVMGLLFGYICIKFKSVYGAILLHMAVNMSGLLLGTVLPEDGGIPDIIFVILSVAGLVGMYVIIKYFQRLKIEEVEENNTLPYEL